MANAVDRLSEEVCDRLQRQSMPAFTQPMLAKLTHDHFADENWVFERKLDGERVLVFHDSSGTRLMSRNEKDLTDTYPKIADALDEQDAPAFISDGEVVAFDGDVTSFSRLQSRMKIKDRRKALEADVQVYYYLFDVLYWDQWDTTGLPFTERKKLLKAGLDWSDPIRYTPHRIAKSLDYYREACEKGWEGLIAKKADSTYAHSRSSNWLKFKCRRRQEFVIGGFTEPKGSRVGFGALLIGYYDADGDALHYAGKVGTGYTDETLRDLRKRLDEREVDEAPFVEEKLPHKGVHWARPELVGEVSYTELTRENRLRHPSFLGLRNDKDPEDIVLEQAQAE